MFWEKMLQYARWIWERFDTILALLLGVVCTILGLLNVLPSSVISSVTLATLAILAFSLIRDRGDRTQFLQQIVTLMKQPKGPDLDAIFYQPVSEETLLQSAEKEMWLVQETGLYIVEANLPLLLSFLQRGGVLKFVLAVPKENVIKQIVFRDYDYSFNAFDSRFRMVSHYFNQLSKDVGEQAENMQIRYSKHIIGASYVLTDPTHQDIQMHRVAVRYPGFRVPFRDRTGLMIQGKTSPNLVHYFHQEAQKLFTFASKIVLLQGDAHIGKTTMLRKLLVLVPQEDQFYLCSIILPHHQSGGTFTGYELVTNFGYSVQDFAVQQQDGAYEIHNHAWEQVIAGLEKACNARKVIVVDGISPALMPDSRLVTILDKIIEDPSMSLFVTFSSEYRNSALLQKLRLHRRSTMLHLIANAKERNMTEQILEQELLASVFVAKNELARGKKR